MIEKVFIIHQKTAVKREKYINRLIIDYPNYEIIEPITPDNLDLYGGKRKKENRKRAELSLTLTNIYIYNRIVQEKLNNVIIFEDDVIQLEPIPELDLDKYIIYLHSYRHENKKSNEIYDCQAMFYPKWQNTKIILDLIKRESKLKIIDVQLQKIKEKYKLDNKICQLNKMVFIQAVGYSSILEYYKNDRYKKMLNL
jgi:hypothetical protein|tara:strand:+ start:495 stop:1085 length:591 start_codon:yes stop_codon:yes gene_type:complete